MHIATHLEYKAFAYGEPEITSKLTDDEKLEHIGVEQLSHVLAVFFLLKHVDLRLMQTDVEGANTGIRHVGQLGSLITECLFTSFDTAVERLKEVTTSTDGPASTKKGEII